MKIPFLSGSVNAAAAFNTISKGIDKLAFTDQERVELNIKLADKVAEFAKNTLSENTIRSKARRVISYVIVFSWLIAAFMDIFVDNVELTYLWQESALKTAFVMVLAFFFGGYYIKQIDMKPKK